MLSISRSDSERTDMLYEFLHRLRQNLVLLFLLLCCMPLNVFAQNSVGTATTDEIAGSGSRAQATSSTPVALQRAHAHNDYQHPRPLLDALERGFTSIEADIFLVDGQLLVAHYLKDTRPERTLDALYLKPLYDRFKANDGKLFAGSEQLILLIDFKNKGAETYRVLEQQLSRYADMISVTVDGNFTAKAVTVVISGDRPVEVIAKSNPRWAGIDGRLSDLDSSAVASLMPLISDDWRRHFSYRGEGELSQDERAKLTKIVQDAHQQGRKVRFWATPESTNLWNELVKAKVDLIGTDRLDQLKNFLEANP